MNPRIRHNIILIGFMGSGKTSVGKKLAEKLSYQFKDTDMLLEQKAGDTISHIFQTKGEEYFRNMETDLLTGFVSGLNHTVLSTGGGLPLREPNAKLLKEMGYVVFLKASKETTVNRLKGDTTRPLLQGENLSSRVEQLLNYRIPLYERAAHKILVTDGKTIAEIVNSIMEFYLKQIC